MHQKIGIIFFLSLIFLISCETGNKKDTAAVTNTPLPLTRTIIVGEALLQVELAVTEKEKVKGLMGRKSLPKDHGMLFVYHKSTTPRFWMKNTHIPLSVAFIDNSKRIIQIEDLEPHSLKRVSPNIPIHFAIEANKGWFEKNNITVGNRFSFKKEPEKSKFIE